MTMDAHRIFRSAVTRDFYVESAFDPIEVLSAKSSRALADLITTRIVEAMAKPLIEIMMPVFQQVLCDTITTIQETRNAKNSATPHTVTASQSKSS